jgi:hypothetical protein
MSLHCLTLHFYTADGGTNCEPRGATVAHTAHRCLCAPHCEHVKKVEVNYQLHAPTCFAPPPPRHWYDKRSCGFECRKRNSLPVPRFEPEVPGRSLQLQWLTHRPFQLNRPTEVQPQADTGQQTDGRTDGRGWHRNVQNKSRTVCTKNTAKLQSFAPQSRSAQARCRQLSADGL